VSRNGEHRSRRITHPVSMKSIRSFLRVPVARRLDWIEEMIELQAALPPRVRAALARHRELARRPAR
jgi:hypothetical protein